MKKTTVTAEIHLGIETRTVTVKGQIARTIRALIEAGPRGITALELARTWAMRLAHYVFVLRRDHGLPIRMEWEPHESSAGPGKHGRYFLDASARIISDSEKREAA